MLSNALVERVLGLGEILRLSHELARLVPELFDPCHYALILLAQFSLPLSHFLNFRLTAHEVSAVEGLDLEAGFELGPNERFGQWRPRTETKQTSHCQSLKRARLIRVLLGEEPVVNERYFPKVCLGSLHVLVLELERIVFVQVFGQKVASVESSAFTLNETILMTCQD